MAEEKPTLSYFEKLKGVKVLARRPYPKWSVPLISGLGGFIAIAVLRLVQFDLQLIACFIIPFGATCLLVFAAPGVPFSQPRNVILGHILAALCGIAVYAIFKQQAWWSFALANGLALALLTATNTRHPPAGATALIPVALEISTVTWAFVPIGVGAVIICAIGWLYNNIWADRHYPTYWW